MTKPKQAQLELLLTISEGLSRGPHEMLQVSPTDAMHAPSCGLAIRDAVEELRLMRAENKRQALHIEYLQAKIDADRSCACSYDAPSDVCAVHSPLLMQARAEIERLRADLATQQGCCDGAAAQDAHVRRERDEHRAEVEKLRETNKQLVSRIDALRIQNWRDRIEAIRRAGLAVVEKEDGR